MKITCKELTPALWDDLETLFGPKGAVGGCWCMSWRLEKGEKWDEVKGPTAKKRFKALVTKGQAFGILAYAGGEPVGWASVGPRPDYFRLDRAPSFACADAADVWSIPCFYVHKDFRGQGVSTAMLAAAEKLIKKKGGDVLEGYPVKPAKDGSKSPAAFAWTGTRSLFDAAGFEVVGNKDGGKQRVRKEL